MIYKNIKKKAEKFREESNKIEERRKTWNNKKEQIYDLLEEIKIEVKLDWQVGRNESVENMTSVYICFNPKRSGITQKVDGTHHNYIYEGGLLGFSQMTNGKIVIILSYPFIKGLGEKPDHEILETIEPKEISDSIIKKYVRAFLDKMIKDLKEANENTIGFNRDKIDS